MKVRCVNTGFHSPSLIRRGCVASAVITTSTEGVAIDFSEDFEAWDGTAVTPVAIEGSVSWLRLTSRSPSHRIDLRVDGLTVLSVFGHGSAVIEAVTLDGAFSLVSDSDSPVAEVTIGFEPVE